MSKHFLPCRRRDGHKHTKLHIILTRTNGVAFCQLSHGDLIPAINRILPGKRFDSSVRRGYVATVSRARSRGPRVLFLPRNAR